MITVTPELYLQSEALRQPGVHICTFPAQKELKVSGRTGEPAYSYTLHPSLNEWTRGNPKMIGRLKKSWEQWFEGHLLECNFPELRSNQVYCFIAYFFADNSPRDYDNYAPKFLMDALKKYGAIRDDSDRVLAAHPFIVHRVCAEDPHILLALTENPILYRQMIDEFLPDMPPHCKKGT